MTEYISSKSETINTIDMRTLVETTNTLGLLLTPEEYQQILAVFSNAVVRVLKENDVEESE